MFDLRRLISLLDGLLVRDGLRLDELDRHSSPLAVLTNLFDMGRKYADLMVAADIAACYS